MYLEGQLPLGPDSGNVDPEGSEKVSPTLANADGVVQMPLTDPKNPGYQVQSGFGVCGAYAADGYLTSIRKDAYRSGLAGCQSGEQGYQDYRISSLAPWGLLLALGAGAFLIGGDR